MNKAQLSAVMSALGKKSWAKRKKNPKERARLARISRKYRASQAMDKSSGI